MIHCPALVTLLVNSATQAISSIISRKLLKHYQQNKIRGVYWNVKGGQKGSGLGPVHVPHCQRPE